MRVTYDEAPDSLRTHIQEIQRADEEVLVAVDIIDKGIVTEYWLVVSTERLITVSLGLIDTTSQSIHHDNIDQATVDVSGHRPKLIVKTTDETLSFELDSRTNEFAQKINSLPTATEDKPETPPQESAIDSSENPHRQELASTLQTGEEMLHTAINAHLQGKQTVPRQRYQQAAQVFNDAEEIIETSDVNLSPRPIRVDIGDPTLSPNRSIDDLPLLPKPVTEELYEAGITTLEEMDSADQDLIEVVNYQDTETRTKIKLHEIWTQSATVSFDTGDMVTDRAELASRAFRLV